MRKGRIAIGIFFGVLVFQSCLVFSAENIKELFNQGQAAFQRGDYEQAIKSYEEAVDLNPNFAPLYNALGLAHSARQEPVSDVVWFFNVAIDIDPQYADAFNNKCRVLSHAGQYNLAEESCLKALAVSPDMTSAQLNLAWLYLLGKKQADAAILYFQKVLAKMKTPMIYYGLGMAYGLKEDAAHVLDVITTLRSMGENNLATQLENGIRKAAGPPPELAPDVVFPASQPGTIVRSSSEETPAVAPQQGTMADMSAANLMRIRLKGRLTTTVNNPTIVPEQKKNHPGSIQ